MSWTTVDDLAQRVLDTVRPWTVGMSKYALLDFPNHNNSGDSAIWLGETACFAALGLQPAYTCDVSTYSQYDLERALPEGPIFLHGGGNFGDLWPLHQEFRKRVLRQFPDRTVVQLPQTVMYRNTSPRDDLHHVLAARTAPYVVLVRDPQSQGRLAEAGLEALLTPDMALCLRRLSPLGAPDHDVVAILRTDYESRDVVPDFGAWSVLVTDWLSTAHAPLRRRLTVRTRTGLMRLAARATSDGARDRTLRRLPMLAHQRMAERRVRDAVGRLSRGRVIVTDRLHGHILATLLGLPQVLLDDGHGKVRRFHDAWTRDVPGVIFANAPSNVPEALEALLVSP